MNWISATGRKPWAASPTDRPEISVSDRGVSITRFGPKRASRPAVARNTPPSTPTSSPSTRTCSSSAKARASARLMASTRVKSRIAVSLDGCGTLFRQIVRQRGIDMVEHDGRTLRRHREIVRDGLLDPDAAVGEQPFLIIARPGAELCEMTPQAPDRLVLPMFGNGGIVPVAGCIVGGGVVAQPVC